MRRLKRYLAMGGVAWLAIACVHPLAPPASAPAYDFFGAIDPHNDPWFYRIQDWQDDQLIAQRDGLGKLASHEAATSMTALEASANAFQAGQRRALARRINTWVQNNAVSTPEAPESSDPDPARLLSAGAEDPLGLDQTTRSLLLRFGFEADELYRGVLRQRNGDRYHVVTLWFEDRRDPWVLDASSVLSAELKRLSRVSSWQLIRVFNETKQFRAVPRAPHSPGIAEN